MDSMKNNRNYNFLFIMIFIHILAMYFLMYSDINIFSNFFHNLERFYMAIIMTVPMIIMEISLMSSMYKDRKQNRIIIIFSLIVLVLLFFFIRQQVGVSDKQFLKSMIPHHSSAILMCEQASIKDSEIKELCNSIIFNQQAEINQMKRILERLEG